MRLIATALNLALLLSATPGFAGLLASIAAWRAGRPAPSPLSPYRSWQALWRAEPVVVAEASPIAAGAAAFSLASAILAAALIPSFTTALVGAPLALLPLLIVLLVLAETAPLLSHLATGTMAGGIDAGRRLAFFVVASPALFLALWALAQLGGSITLSVIAVQGGAGSPLLPHLLAMAALLALARAAPSAAPSLGSHGRARVLALAASALTRLCAASLFAALSVPYGLSGDAPSPAAWGFGALLWAGKIAFVTLVFGLVRGTRPAGARLLTASLATATLCAFAAALLSEAPRI